MLSQDGSGRQIVCIAPNGEIQKMFVSRSGVVGGIVTGPPTQVAISLDKVRPVSIRAISTA
jgi:hypothetical protein